jgi:hypothetical protein
MGTTLIGIVFNGTIILGADRRQLTYRDGAFADQSKIRKYLRLRLNASKTTDASKTNSLHFETTIVIHF